MGKVDRPNLTFRMSEREEGGIKQIIETLKLHEKEAGIIYCLKRADVDKISEVLNKKGYINLPYHAGLPDVERKKNQEAFLTEKVSIIVATIAFGMGIDRSNIRFVIHAAMPKSVEHYQQETGRAGRDGLPSYCYMFYSGADYRTWEYIFQKSFSGQSAHKKLGEMYNFSNVPVCRHRYLSEYFGQNYPKTNCNSCDFCLDEVGTLPESDKFAKSIIEGVFGVEERFGAEHVSNVLVGNTTEGIERWGHHTLPFYGTLKGETKRAVRSMIDQLIAQRYLRRSGEYLTLSVTEEGLKILSGQESPKLTRILEKEKKAVIKKKQKLALESDYANMEIGLFESLKRLRRALADKKNMPSYIVCSDRTLKEMAEKKPKTEGELRTIFGIGEAKLRDYGEIFLNAVREYEKR